MGFGETAAQSPYLEGPWLDTILKGNLLFKIGTLVARS